MQLALGCWQECGAEDKTVCPRRNSNHVPGQHQVTSRHATSIICPWRHPERPRQWRPKASRVHGGVGTLANRLQQPKAHIDCSPATCPSHSGTFGALPPRQFHTLSLRFMGSFVFCNNSSSSDQRPETSDCCSHWYGHNTDWGSALLLATWDIKLNSVALVRTRTIPTERPPPVGEVSANFLRIEECHVVSATGPHSR